MNSVTDNQWTQFPTRCRQPLLALLKPCIIIQKIIAQKMNEQIASFDRV